MAHRYIKTNPSTANDLSCGVRGQAERGNRSFYLWALCGLSLRIVSLSNCIGCLIESDIFPMKLLSAHSRSPNSSIGSGFDLLWVNLRMVLQFAVVSVSLPARFPPQTLCYSVHLGSGSVMAMTARWGLSKIVFAILRLNQFGNRVYWCIHQPLSDDLA